MNICYNCKKILSDKTYYYYAYDNKYCYKCWIMILNNIMK